jgi:hypothetical protein
MVWRWPLLCNAAYVTRSHMFLVQDDVEVGHFSCAEESSELSPQNSGITIVKLGPGQALKVTCIATLVRVCACVCRRRTSVPVSVTECHRRRCEQGVAKMHAKWSPVGTAVFQYEHEIRLNPGTAQPHAQ